MVVYDSTINDTSDGEGILINNVSANVYVQDTSFDNNINGVTLFSGHATVADSSAEHGSVGFGAYETGDTLTLINDRALFNGTGLLAQTGGTLYFADCLIANNSFAYFIGTGSSMTATNPGTSLIAPGQTTFGMLSTAITLQ